MISEKLKLRKGQFFMDRFVHNFNKLEKVFFPTRFNLAYAGKHISILFWYLLLSKVKTKLKRACSPSLKKEIQTYNLAEIIR